jgi:hypothetical protein
MSSQKRTIMGACDYSIETLKNLKRDMSIIGAKNSEILWAIGGIVCSLNSALLMTCDEVFNASARDGGSNAKKDLQEIQRKFNAFIDRMIENA